MSGAGNDYRFPVGCGVGHGNRKLGWGDPIVFTDNGEEWNLERFENFPTIRAPLQPSLTGHNRFKRARFDH